MKRVGLVLIMTVLALGLAGSAVAGRDKKGGEKRDKAPKVERQSKPPREHRSEPRLDPKIERRREPREVPTVQRDRRRDEPKIDRRREEPRVDRRRDEPKLDRRDRRDEPKVDRNRDRDRREDPKIDKNRDRRDRRDNPRIDRNRDRREPIIKDRDRRPNPPRNHREFRPVRHERPPHYYLHRPERVVYRYRNHRYDRVVIVRDDNYYYHTDPVLFAAIVCDIFVHVADKVRDCDPGTIAQDNHTFFASYEIALKAFHDTYGDKFVNNFDDEPETRPHWIPTRTVIADKAVEIVWNTDCHCYGMVIGDRIEPYDFWADPNAVDWEMQNNFYLYPDWNK